MSSIDVDFVIPTLNTNPASLSTCQESILSQQGSFNKKIIIEEGLGFAKGVNSAIRKGESPYLAIINDDVRLAGNWLQEAYNTLNTFSDCAAVATCVLTYDGKYIDSCGMDVFVSGKAKKRGQGERNNDQKIDKPAEVFGVPCSAAFFRRNAIEEVGLFDEDFNSYGEDVDLSFRLRINGYKIYYAPKAISYHKMHATSSKMGNFKARMDAKNWIYIIIKNYPSNIIIQFIQELTLERLRNLSGLIKSTLSIYKWRSIWLLPMALILVYGEVLVKVPRMIGKRYKMKKNKSYKDEYLRRWLMSTQKI